MSSYVPWIAFVLFILLLVAVDLGLHRGSHASLTPRRALAWSGVWVGVSLAFGGVVWWLRGGTAAADFYTGWLVEKSLSVDNLFVFLLLFRQFGVPREQQHRVLTWGILGALAARGLLIVGGIELLERWHGLTWVLAGALVLTGVRTLVAAPAHERSAGESRIVRAARRVLPIAPRYEGGRFFTREGGRRVGTLLLLVLVAIEATDVLFAADSLPAIFAVTADPFIVFSSNILAVLGLRALYFALADLLTRLSLLHLGLGVILLLAGVKLGIGHLVEVPAWVSLVVTLGVLTVTVAASLWLDARARRRGMEGRRRARAPTNPVANAVPSRGRG